MCVCVCVCVCVILVPLNNFQTSIRFIKFVALQLRRARTDWSGCCQMTVQGALWLAKRLSLNLNFSFLNRISYFSYQVATQLSSRGWVDPIPDPILPEKFLRYSRESNPGPLGWQSDVLTTIPNRWSSIRFIRNFIHRYDQIGKLQRHKSRSLIFKIVPGEIFEIYFSPFN